MAVLGGALVSGGTAGAVTIDLSTAGSAPTLGGLTFRNGDVVRYDTLTDTSTLLFDEDAFTSGPEDVDAFELLANGHMIISALSTATLGGLTFSRGSLAEYDPVSGTATLFFDEALFGAPANVDGVAVLPSGNLVLSTDASQTLGGLAFRDGDLVEYDPIAGTATLFFSEDLFGGDENVDAVDVLPDGRIVLSTAANATLGGLSFRNGDLALYDPGTGTATLFFSEDNFSASEDVDAVAVPEPAAATLLALGLVGLAAAGGRRSS
jgi:hypothetical protein